MKFWVKLARSFQRGELFENVDGRRRDAGVIGILLDSAQVR